MTPTDGYLGLAALQHFYKLLDNSDTRSPLPMPCKAVLLEAVSLLSLLRAELKARGVRTGTG